MKVIPYGKQNITEEDLQSVVEVLHHDFLTQGPEIAKFETAFAEYVGAKYAVALANGTAALHLCALALGVQEGQKVITTPITFAASGNCVKYCGGELLFADIDPDTYLIDIESVRKLLEADTNNEIKGIIPVDFAGRSVDMEAFRKLASEHNCWIIEDACHAPGGHFLNSESKNVPTGSGQYADLAIFSFHPVKHIAAGEGGMISTNDQDLYEKLLQLRTHGIVKGHSYQNSVADAVGEQFEEGITEYPAWYMEMQSLGYNYRLTDFQAALGHSQLKRADAGLARRREIAKKYATAFADESFIHGQSGVVDGHAYHLYVIEVDDRLGLYNHLRTLKIFAQIHYIPMHKMPYYKSINADWSFPNAERYYSRCLSLPMFPTLSEEDQQFVIDSIKGYYAS